MFFFLAQGGATPPGTNAVLQQLTNQTYQQPFPWWMTYLFLGSASLLVAVFWWSLNRTTKAEDAKTKMAIDLAHSIESSIEEDIKEINEKLDRPHALVDSMRDVHQKLDRLLELLLGRK